MKQERKTAQKRKEMIQLKVEKNELAVLRKERKSKSHHIRKVTLEATKRSKDPAEKASEAKKTSLRKVRKCNGKQKDLRENNRYRGRPWRINIPLIGVSEEQRNEKPPKDNSRNSRGRLKALKGYICSEIN